MADLDGDLDVFSASATDGKLAWYRNEIGLDFGDAPAPYFTTAADNGASHAATGPYFGSLRDAEADGQSTLAANGDDSIDLSDDDGITFKNFKAGSHGSQGGDNFVTSEITTIEDETYVDVWIDFNGDDSWGGPNEHFVSYRDVDAGTFILSSPATVPSWAQGTGH
ncbi:MAG: hypothetical protein ACI9G1_001665 [Pirellulaceae bacterium]